MHASRLKMKGNLNIEGSLRPDRSPFAIGKISQQRNERLGVKLSTVPPLLDPRVWILQDPFKVALRFSGVNFVSLNFTDYVSMALCMGDNRVGDTSDLPDLPQDMGLARRGSS